MQFLGISVTFALILFTISTALVTPNKDLHLIQDRMEGFEYAPLRMTGTVGHIVLNHTGTIEEITAQLAVENPDFDLDEVDDIVASEGLEKRDKLRKTKSSLTSSNVGL